MAAGLVAAPCTGRRPFRAAPAAPAACRRRGLRASRTAGRPCRRRPSRVRPWLRRRCGWGSSSRSCRPVVEQPASSQAAAASAIQQGTTDNLARNITSQAFVKQVPSIISTDPLDDPEARTSSTTGADAGRGQRNARLRRSTRRSTASGSTARWPRWCPEFSRSYLQQLIEAGAVRAAAARGHQGLGHRCTRATPGAIELRPTPQSQAFKPEPMELARGARGRAPAA